MALPSAVSRGFLEGTFVPSSIGTSVSRTGNRELLPLRLSGNRKCFSFRKIHCSKNDLVPPVAGATPSRWADSSATLRSTSAATNSLSSFSNNLPKIHDMSGGMSSTRLENLSKGHAPEVKKMKEYIQEIRMMFRSLGDGEISVSPYDTAWVALVPALDGSKGPQFPECLEWITKNQCSGGSWGDEDFFLFYDRIVNTLGCVIALKTWGASPEAVEKGVEFIQDNLHKMESEEDAHMPIGFEIVFPMMLKNAQMLGLNLPYDAPVIKAIEEERRKKLEKIPMEIVHKYPTTLLHSLEGVHELLDWEKLLKLQSSDGSFLCSPAATACALMYTKNEKCLAYIEKILKTFGNAVPNVYPVDLFERMWMVDRLERLGIARYFQNEIKDCLEYVYKHWTKNGLAWSTSANVKEVDDTAMGFRLLRQHGYDVSADVFRQFRGENGEFFCFAGQSGQAVTGMFNLYRASQTRFPGETILEEAYHFTRAFLDEKYATNKCYDKWIITKDLEGEVGYALDLPWFCSLPRIENRVYLDHYAANDVWIGKCLYRMPYVNNETFLALAKADFNLCQSIHQIELQQILRWIQDCEFTLTYGKQRTYEWYFSAVSHLPRPELAVARLVWARNCVLTSVIRDFFESSDCLEETRAFLEALKSWDFSALDGVSTSARALYEGFYNTVNVQIHEGLFAQDRDLGPYFRAIWQRWLESMVKEVDWKVCINHDVPSFKEYLRNAEISVALEPVVRVTALFLGEPMPEDETESDDSRRQYLMQLANRVGRLSDDIRKFKSDPCKHKLNAVSLLMHENPGLNKEVALNQLQTMVNDAMLELSQEVHRPCGIPNCVKQLYFNAARSMMLGQRTSDRSLRPHIKRILFEPVVEVI